MQFFQELYSHIDKNLGEEFEDMFLVKIASKGTSLIVDLNKTILAAFILRLVRHPDKNKIKRRTNNARFPGF